MSYTLLLRKSRSRLTHPTSLEPNKNENSIANSQILFWSPPPPTFISTILIIIIIIRAHPCYLWDRLYNYLFFKLRDSHIISLNLKFKMSFFISHLHPNFQRHTFLSTPPNWPVNLRFVKLESIILLIWKKHARRYYKEQLIRKKTNNF